MRAHIRMHGGRDDVHGQKNGIHARRVIEFFKYRNRMRRVQLEYPVTG